MIGDREHPSTRPSAPEAAPDPVFRWARGRALGAVRIDLPARWIELSLEGGSLLFTEVISSNLLGPWDGAEGTIEDIEVVDQDADVLCLEIRVRFTSVPRRYRVVCRHLSKIETAPPC